MRLMNKLVIVGGALALAACAAQTQSVSKPEGLDVAGQMEQAKDEHGAWTYLDPAADLKSYTKFIIAEPKIYRGQGSSYGSLSDAELQQIAGMFAEELRKALEPTYPIVDKAGPGVATIQVTLIGVTSTVPYVSTATRLIPIGAAINLLSTGAGAGGTLTGSVTYGIEAKDSVSGTTLGAAIRELTPGAFDLSSTLGTLDTARAVARDAAAKLRARLDKLHGAG